MGRPGRSQLELHGHNLSASNNWLVVGGGVIDFNDSVSATLSQIVFAVQQLAKDGYEIKASAVFGNGYVYGYVLAEYLRVASQLDGGLTRPNLMLAIRAMDFTSPFMMPGIKLNMNGPRTPTWSKDPKSASTTRPSDPSAR